MAYTPTNWQNLPNTTTPVIANNLNNMENGIEKSDKVIGGDEYDSTATYEIGDFCIYNNKLYRCITAISTAEAFTPAHWEETSVENELDALRKSGGIPTNSVIGYDGSTIPSGFEEVDDILKWTEVGRNATANSNTTITVQNLELYHEVMFTIGPVGDVSRVLSSATVPMGRFKVTGDASNGYYQTNNYTGSVNFLSGISYLGNNQIKLYASSNTGVVVYVR